MSLGYYMADGRLLETVFKAAGGNQRFGYLDASGQDIGQILYAGSSTTNAGYLCSDGVDLGRRLMGNVNVTCWGNGVSSSAYGTWAYSVYWSSGWIHPTFTIGGNGSGHYRVNGFWIGRVSDGTRVAILNQNWSVSGNQISANFDMNDAYGSRSPSTSWLYVSITDLIAGGSFDLHCGYIYRVYPPCNCDNDCYYCSCDSCDCD
jgi:hypothetical protein